MMSKPTCPQKAPYAVDVEKGKTYFWCTCGLSAKQPFCDGTHKGSGFKCIPWVADASETVYFCGCKATKTAPFCDGSHSSLT